MNTPLPDQPINPLTLFADEPERHVCCSCCEGYCPMDDADTGPDWSWMYRVEVDGVAYLTDRYVAVRADLCQPMPESVQVQDLPAQDGAEKGFIVPGTEPPLTESRITSWTWHRIARAGLTVHGDSLVLHLHIGGVHAGWVMPATEGAGITRHQLGEVRRVARAAGITLRQAEKAVLAVIEG